MDRRERALIAENNEDPDEDGTPGDYPDFLLPNTTYYMQIFSPGWRIMTIYTMRYGPMA